MPHTKSAWKRLRQNEKRRARNKTTVKALKKQQRVVADALTTSDPAKAAAEIVTATKKLDKAAARGYIHKNKAARLKSRMAKKLATLQAGGAAPKA